MQTQGKNNLWIKVIDYDFIIHDVQVHDVPVFSHLKFD